MAYDLFQVIATWQDIGIYGVLLPFLLIFAITFAILEKINIFGAGKKKINVIVALVLGLLFLQNIYLVERLQFILPKVGFSLLIFVLLLLLVGSLTGKAHDASDKKWTWLAFLVAIIFLAWAISPFETFDNALDPILLFFDSVPQWIVILAIVGGLIYLIVNEKPTTTT